MWQGCKVFILSWVPVISVVVFVFVFFSLQSLHAAELLNLYINYDMLEEATYLALEYIDAVMGKGTEYFGLTVSHFIW